MQSSNTENGVNPPLLSVRDLSVKFGSHGRYFEAVKNLSLDIGHNEIVGLIGESGSGKTTCAHSVIGLVEGIPGIVSGSVQLEGKEILPPMQQMVTNSNDRVKKNNGAFRSKHRSALKPVLGKLVTCIFQEPKSALNPFLSIGNQLMDCISRGRNAQVADKEKFGKDLLMGVGIVDAELVWNNYPHQMSGGMAQRVMIAMALSSKPKLLMADEPTTALDVTTQAKLLRLFLKFRQEEELSILLISHDIGVVREVADRVYVMYQGQIVESGLAEDVIYRPVHDYTKLLLSSFDNLALRH